LPVEGATHRVGSARPPRDPLHAHLSRLPAVGSGRMPGCHFRGLGPQTSSGRASGHACHPWRWHHERSEEGRR
jgi:hypothetical protein